MHLEVLHQKLTTFTCLNHILYCLKTSNRTQHDSDQFYRVLVRVRQVSWSLFSRSLDLPHFPVIMKQNCRLAYLKGHVHHSNWVGLRGQLENNNKSQATSFAFKILVVCRIMYSMDFYQLVELFRIQIVPAPKFFRHIMTLFVHR